MTDDVATLNENAHTIPITVSFGDGDGPEIMEHILTILREARAPLSLASIDIGENFYKREHYNGIPPSAWKTIERHPVIFMAPTQAPDDVAYHDILQTFSRCLELHSIVSPVSHKDNRQTIVARNESAFQQPLFYRHSAGQLEEKHFYTKTQAEHLSHHAISTAQIMSVDNIHFLQRSSTALHDAMLWDRSQSTAASFQEFSFYKHRKTLAEALQHHMEGVLVSQSHNIANSLALMNNAAQHGCALLGERYVLFTCTAPTATFSGMLHAAILMLAYLGHPHTASFIHNAWLAAEETENAFPVLAIHEQATLVLEHLGKEPQTPIHYGNTEQIGDKPSKPIETHTKQLVGAECFLTIEPEENDWPLASQLAEQLQQLTANTHLKLQMIASRGFPVWPHPNDHQLDENDCIHARFIPADLPKKASPTDVIELLRAITEAGVEIANVQYLHVYGEEIGFSNL